MTPVTSTELIGIAKTKREMFRANLTRLNDVIAESIEEILDNIITHNFVKGVVAFDITAEEVEAILTSDEYPEIANLPVVSSNSSQVLKSDVDLVKFVDEAFAEYAETTDLSITIRYEPRKTVTKTFFNHAVLQVSLLNLDALVINA